MAQRILKNNTAAIVPIPDTGFSVPASGQLVIDPTQYGKFEGSNDVIVEIGAAVLTVNDGTFDLSITEGTRLIQGGFSRPISDGADPTIKATVIEDLVNAINGLTTLIVDGGGTGRIAEVVQRSDGRKALATDARVIVETTFGIDPIPDSAIRIVNTGPVGSTWDFYIAGTNNDPSAPDRDLPAYNKQFIVQAGEVGDEIAFRDRIVTELNNDLVFKDTVLLKADAFTDRAMVHITSTAFSAFPEEFYSRPNAGDFAVTVSAGAQVDVIWDDFIPRNKPVSLARDPDNPHIGVFGISGSVTVTAKDLDDLFIQFATDDGTPITERGGTGDNDLLVDGSVTPVEFTVPAQSETDIFVSSMIFRCQGNGIKLNNFFAKNSAITNGVEVEVKSNNIITPFPLLRSTADFKNRWAALSGTTATWDLAVESGVDEALAIVSFENPFILKVTDSFGAGNDDYIQVKIQDPLQSGNAKFDFLVRGFEKEP